MQRRDWRLRVHDILGAIAKIERYRSTMTRDEFIRDEKTVDAVVRNIGVIGEAARRVPEDVTTRFPDIPWAEMADMRNVVVHEYFGVDLDILWETLERDLPPLVPALERMLIDDGRS